MSFLRTFIHHPRKLFLRRALFQIHLWAGVLCSLYIIVIALTGAVLVFEDELTSSTFSSSLTEYDPSSTATVPTVVRDFEALYPGGQINSLTLPSSIIPAFQIRAVDANKLALNLIADPATAAIYPQPRTWVNRAHDLHIYLLLGSAHGMQVNGVGAVILLLLSSTGLILWWPGIKTWTRGLQISLRHNWRRINFDAHSAIGIWTLGIVCWWSFSGVYFAWYRQVASAVNHVSPLRGMVSPTSPAPASVDAGHTSLESILTAAHQASPRGRLFSISNPSLSAPTVVAQMDLRASGDFSHRDIVTLATADGRVLSIWHYGDNRTLGDWILWAMHPLHFGTLWGLAFKIIWFLLGISLAILSLSGLIMYWNRHLRHLIGTAASGRS